MSEVNMMDEEFYDYHAYLLRLWRTEYKGQWHWRASLESPHTGERQSFTSLEQCFAFLRELCSSQASDLPRREWNYNIKKVRLNDHE